jgi:hypothetical protein
MVPESVQFIDHLLRPLWTTDLVKPGGASPGPANNGFAFNAGIKEELCIHQP